MPLRQSFCPPPQSPTMTTPQMVEWPQPHHIDFHMPNGDVLVLELMRRWEFPFTPSEALRMADFVIAVLSSDDDGPYIVLKHRHERPYYPRAVEGI